ncbi:MAG: undecaprenyl/decaprenyl-phosphate alpha-N-acetylglucosaminyl 1-phosphate transferase [Elusimicrobiaceae bacterium]|nr:undecaprenyl/decaprenyl-phosphate alpha-N-acetylglucosaminyl 1-phosphate transferase [Elusimicrobiaceae bacterium]
MELLVLYFIAFLCAGLVTTVSLPLVRRTLGRFLTDTPGGLKTHAQAVPMLGGCAIFAGTLVSLILIRFITNFPTGTLHSLRGILGAGTLIFALGLLDDLRKPKGLPIYVRLLVQVVACAMLVTYDVYVQVFPVAWLNYALTFLWLLALTNAFNLLDIADGLCVSQAVICAAGLLLISLPGELWYVNFAAVALLGACLAFWPHNHTQKKIFLGDSGSTFLGFFIAAVSMGTQYSQINPFGYAAPLFIAAVPLLDTAFVSIARILQGKNPLKGSPDHLALRLKNELHFSNTRVLAAFAAGGVLCNAFAYFLTYMAPSHTPGLVLVSLLMGGMFLLWLLQKLPVCKH